LCGRSDTAVEQSICALHDESVEIRITTAEAVRPLRGRVLRPTQPPESYVFPGDADERTTHFAVLRDDEIVGIASLYREPPPNICAENTWRLRGMATDPSVRGAGFGGRLLQSCIEHARANDGKMLWCNARLTAQGFYERFGFSASGESFELPHIGMHVYMSRSLEP
jgi:predicted GNAT family N-acyltransferase